MIRFYGLLTIIELGLLVYCLIDCIQTDSTTVRNLPKLGWLLLILVFPLVGGIAWLVAGRPRPGPSRRWASPPRGPDDDPDFLRRLRRDDPPADPDPRPGPP
jgi:hypothetical protein